MIAKKSVKKKYNKKVILAKWLLIYFLKIDTNSIFIWTVWIILSRILDFKFWNLDLNVTIS